MSGMERLRDQYFLSPTTVAGLAQIRGVPVPPPTPASPSAPPVDPDSYEAWAAAAGPGGVRNVEPGQTYGDVQGDKDRIAGPNQNVIVGSGVGAEPARSNPAPVSETADEEPSVGQQQQSYGAEPSRQVVLPAHWQPGTHAVSIARGINPLALQPGQEERELGYREERAAGDARYEAAQQAGMADAIYSAAHAVASKQANDRIAQIQNERAQYVANTQAKFDALNLEAQKKVDPNALWKERGTGAQVFAAIMIGLNEFGIGLSGHGQNTALQIINNAIDRNIDKQKTNIANARAALDKESDLYSRNLAEFGDRERATLATKVQYLDQVSAMLDQKRAEMVKTPEAEAAWRDMKAKIYGQRAAASDEFAMRTEDKVTEQENEHYVPAQVMGGGASKREGNLVTTADGTTYHFGSEKTAEEATKRLQAFGDVQYLTNRILKVRKETMKLDPIVDKAKYQANMLDLKKLDDDLAVAESLSGGQGTVTAADTERRRERGLESTAGLGTFKAGQRVFSSAYESANHAYEMSAKDSTQRQRAFVQTAGGEIYQRDYQRDAAGNLVPTGRYTGQDAKPPQRIAPHGAKPMDPRSHIETDEAPDYETTPKAPIRAGVFQASSGAGGGKKGSGGKSGMPPPRKRGK